MGRMTHQLRQAIAALSARVPPREAAAAAAEMSQAYRKAEFAAPPLRSIAHRVAYLQVRMPATHAALRHVFGEVAQRMPGWTPTSMLDVGAGPGTTAWAALEQFPGLERITLLERDPHMVEIGRELAGHAAHPALRSAQWRVGDASAGDLAESDLVVASYALGELTDAARAWLLRRMWGAARVLVMVEPGTRRGFGHVLAARQELIASGARIAAPCPHALACPMVAAGDWCHFSARVERSAEHRRMKGAELGYEDEKFAYIVAAKESVAAAGARVVRHPLHHGGHTQMVLCTPAGLDQRTVTRSQKEAYRRARKVRWGDEWV